MRIPLVESRSARDLGAWPHAQFLRHSPHHRRVAII
ncbi:hypothetical protein NPIL_647561, partial [Nephila pilipes]